MKKNSIVFLIRAYNESSRIVGVIESILAAWYDQILIIDDGSTDGTDWLVREKFSHPIRIIRHPINRGGWAALETGFAYIRSHGEHHGWEYIVTFDADGQHNIADLGGFISVFEEHPRAEVVYGSRFITKTRSNVPLLRKIILWWGRIFTSLISWAHLTDAHNGYRMLRREVIEKIYLTMDGMEYASELIDELYLAGCRIREVPVNIHYDDYTLGKWQRYGGAVRIMLRMIYKKFF
jgi:polyprenyl-phospho-N-acetylgalactosaminyl synthase